MKSSFHSLITLLPSLLNHSTVVSRDSQFSLQFLCSWQAGVSKLTCHKTIFVLFITSRHGPHRKLPLYCSGGVFTAPLHSNGRGTDHIENTALPLLRACLLHCSIATAVRVTSRIETVSLFPLLLLAAIT
jgi:hypothetical protein